MPEPYKDMAPILDMFGALIRSPKVSQILKNWKESLRKGMLNFGTKERLSPDLAFNLLVYQHLTPTASKSGNRVFLDIQLEIAGVISNTAFRHEKFNHLANEMMILKAVAHWDYQRNNRFLNLALNSEATLCIPKEVDPDMEANAGKHIHEIARHCALWLLTSQAIARQ